MPQKKRAKAPVRKAAVRRKKSKSIVSKPRFSKRSLAIFGLAFAVIGAYFLFRIFAATQRVDYFGTLTASKPTASYSLTTGAGTMNVVFSNNTADVTLTIKNKANNVVGTIKSKGRTDVKLSLPVTADTYTFSLATTGKYSGSKARKGYAIHITYPVKDVVAPTAIISSPFNQSTNKGTVDFTVIAQDERGITKVEFYIDGALFGTDSTSPYSVRWDTTKVADGTHSLSIKSYSTTGSFVEASGEVTVKNSVTPPPPAGNTLLGVSGSTPVAGAADRIFYQTSKTVAQRTAGAPRVHVSWKVLGETPLTDDQFIAVVKNLRDGDKVEYEHETDAKYRKDGNATNLANRLKAKNYLYDQVVRLRNAGKIPQLDVVNTLTSYAFEGKLFNDVTKYDAKADVLGADLDGGAFPHDYSETKRLDNIVAHAKAHYGSRFTVPEFGWDDDPAGGRMPTIIKQIAGIAKFGPEEIQYHNNPSFGAVLTAAELVEMTNLVSQYNN